MAGCRCDSSRRSLSASHSIVRLFPDPCVCQTIPPPRTRFPRRPDSAHRLVHGDELLIARQLADGPAAFDLEHDEAPHDVEEVARFQQPVEQDVLRRRRAPELPAELLHAQGIGLLPFEEEALRRADRAVDRTLAAGPNEDLGRLEQPRRGPDPSSARPASW